jgi:hypothetical protein
MVVALTVTIRDMVSLHPYQAVYFNRLFAGGLAGADGRFDTDYWGSSNREAVQWVVRNVAGDGIRIANCSHPRQFSYYLEGGPSRFIPVSIQGRPDIILATTRWNCHRQPGARVLHAVERQGVALAYVLDVRK